MARKFLYGILENKQMIVSDIVGVEHFAALRSGAIVTCNHFNAFDSFAMQMAYESAGHKKRKLYRVIREGNYTSFPGFYGYLMKNYNTLPLASKPAAMKEFVRATDTLLKEGNFVLIYPEQSMWWNYRKPKPLKSGGFYFAAKNQVPVLPCYIILRDSDIIGEDGFPVQEYTIHILEPIYPDADKSVSENSKIMMEKNFEVWKQLYEREYGIPLRYTTEL
jgi:1-acyl-sn-glycerol-3-phosphate acyltransferase